ncbi:hypothetical protein [Halorubrum sp. BOL3-1]|uniref:hypothetical protein n=1 Tax=Halorubrum sp. BOL3-1 TaxID=2497325 RepID=UPI001F4F9922|nr:hypothetical protein [Halorubrum sp. BOL3-1]
MPSAVPNRPEATHRSCDTLAYDRLPSTVPPRRRLGARGLSRLRYALLTGIVVTASALGVGVALDASTTVYAVTMGAVMTVLYYAGDVDSENE